MTDKSISIYDRIKAKEDEIEVVENFLEKLNKELQALYDEKNNEESYELFMKIKDKGLTVEETLELLK